MIDLFFEIPLEESTKLDIPATAIRSEAAPALPKATAARDACARPFCNNEWNSRLDHGAPSATWPVRWETALDPKSPPSYVSRAADRILVQGGGQWQLFDVNGKAIATAPVTAGEALMDPVHSLVYAMDQNGNFSAYRFADGQKAFSTSAAYGDTFWRQYMVRAGNRLVIVGVEHEGFPHRPAPPNRSVIQLKEMTGPLRVQEDGTLLSVRDVGSLRAETSTVAVAMHGETLVFAVPNRVYLTGLDLKISAAFEDTFEPVILSLDETGRIYLVVKRAERLSLWVLTPQGQRVMSYELPAQFGTPLGPPIVGYDHRVYMTSPGHTLAIDPDGKLAWQLPSSGPSAIGPDGQLLVASGSALVAFDGRGNRRVLREFPGEVLKTPPITTEDGDILIASDRHLYRLTPR